MGTDIHMVTEKKVADGWLGVNGFPNLFMTENSSTWPRAVDRNYDLFAALASVRGEGMAPKGLPDDASVLTRLMLDAGSDDHSHSWLSVEEAVPIFVRHVLPMIAHPGLSPEDATTDYVIYLFGAVGARYASLSQWRIVFWFNN